MFRHGCLIVIHVRNCRHGILTLVLHYHAISWKNATKALLLSAPLTASTWAEHSWITYDEDWRGLCL